MRHPGDIKLAPLKNGAGIHPAFCAGLDRTFRRDDHLAASVFPPLQAIEIFPAYLNAYGTANIALDLNSQAVIFFSFMPERLAMPRDEDTN